MRGPVLAASPNAAHRALAAWEASLAPDQELLIVTQNVDALHQRAGSRNVVELHGNIMLTKCSNPACSLQPYRNEQGHLETVPTCPKCASVLRPDVMLFAEETRRLAMLDRQARTARLRPVHRSRNIGPGGACGQLCQERGVRRRQNDPGQSRADENPNPAFKEQYFGPAEKVLPELLATGA